MHRILVLKMKDVSLGILTTAILGLSLGAAQAPTPPTTAPAKPKLAVSHPQTAAPATTAVPAAEAQNALIKQNCVGCHNDKAKTGGLTLAGFDAAHPEQNPEVAEKMIHKLRLGMMPPPEVRRRPDAAAVTALVTSLETRIDANAALHPNPGRRAFQRLNRDEYERPVRDLVDLNVDVNAFLPPDTISNGFDNIADAQSFSPTLMEGYLRAASRISALAVGDRNASPTEATYKVPRTQSQMHRSEE